MSRINLSQAKLYFASIVIISFFWLAVPNANAGTQGACCEPNGACQVVNDFICFSTPGANYQGNGTTCDADRCAVTPDSRMCYQTQDDNTQVGNVDIEVPDFLVDMNCVDLGQTRVYCKPACIDIVTSTGFCDDYSDETDMMCYRFGQCVQNGALPPEQVFVEDALNPGGRFISNFDEHLLCVPAEELPAPSPTPTPIPSGIECAGDIGSTFNCNAGPANVCGDLNYVCDASGQGSPTTKCAKSVNKNRCCANAVGSVGDTCDFSNPDP